MNLAEFSVKSPTKITMLFLLVILLGWISLNRLPINLFPDLRTPRITTQVQTRGLSPQEMERRVAQPFERALYTIRGVTDVKSISRADSVILIAEFTWDTPMDYAFLDMNKSVAVVQRGLGDDVESVNVLRFDPNARPVLTLSLVGGSRTSPEELRRLAQRILEPQFERIEGVASVVVTGGDEQEILVRLDEVRMLADRLDVNQVVSAIRSGNVNASGGWIEEGTRRYLLKAIGEAENIEQLGDIVVGRRGTTPIRLREVAEIEYAPRKRKSIVRLDGQSAVGLAFYKESSANTVGVARKVREEMKTLAKILPPDTRLEVAQDQSRFIQAAIGEVKNNALIGGLLAIVILFVFLRDLRSTLVIGVSIPISVVATFTLMYFMDLSLNLMTLGGLALGVGMLVDNAIVSLENIHRLHTEGLPSRESAVRGSREVAGALIASTLTTVVVFLPIVYVHGVAGLLFKEQALTVSFSLLASLVVALLLIPLLSYWMYHTGERVNRLGVAKTATESESEGSSAGASASGGKETTPQTKGSVPDLASQAWPTRLYARFLGGSLRYRMVVFFIGLLLLAGAAHKAMQLPQEFFPKTPQKEVRLRLVLPPSAPIYATENTVRAVEAFLKPLKPAIEHVFVRIGETEEQTSTRVEDPDGPNTAEIFITLKSHDKPSTELLAAGLMNFTSLDLVGRMKPLLDRLPDVRAEFEAQQGNIMELIGGSQAPLLIEIMGPESAQLAGIAETLQRRLETIPGVVNARTNILEGAPEARLYLDPTALSVQGFTPAGLASAISDRLQGKVSSTLKTEAGDVDIRVKVDTAEGAVDALRGMLFQSPTGAKVSLGSLADIRVQRGPREIVRNRQERTAYVMADLDRIPLSVALERVRAVVREDELPRGYRLAFTGEQQQKAEAFGRLGFALTLSILLVYMVMASIFESLLQPFLILLTIPLAGIGVVAGLLAADQSLNVMAYIGIVMLGGIVVNNAIVLLDRVNQLRAGGMTSRDSILWGGVQRLRPVLMTSLTTMLGLLPLGLGFGEGAELRQAMAVAVIGGIFSSTLLTLIVIPCAQSVLDDVLGAARAAWNRMREGRKGPKGQKGTEGQPAPREQEG